MNKNIHNQCRMRKIRRALRNNQTPYEIKLWEYLRARQFLGLKWRRQHSLDNMIVDFFCYECRVVIEIDGDSHMEEEVVLRDKRLSALCAEEEIEIVRFTNREVMENIEGCLERLKDVCLGKTKEKKKITSKYFSI